ncbi:MAG: PPOX class F420-dependent oxidoreductase [Anaerolineae bacterium]|nr:PPOX class F420-dependent oxidoreductase [Thermoflexales bacterium]MDW8406279.1 PPOX class F420-dependent oxidoreductase [Anaerolineae bacterium]
MAQAESLLEGYKDLFNKRAFAHLATLMPDGSPQVTPVWVDFDGVHVIVNTARGRQKDRNLQHDARVAIEIQDPDNPYRYVQIRGRVVEMTEEGADANIDQLAFKYTGSPTYQFRQPGERRVMVKIRPEKVSGMG